MTSEHRALSLPLGVAACQRKALDTRPRMAKAGLKNLEAEAASRAAFGRVLRRAVALAGLIDKEAAARLEVDPAQLSRWCSGHENAQVWRFQADPVLGPALLAAQAEATPGATVRTVIEVERKVG